MDTKKKHDDSYSFPTANDILVARWRERLILPALAFPKGSHERAAVIEELVSKDHLVPSGSYKRVSYSTVGNWIKAYEENGLNGLIRKGRSDKGTEKVLVSRAWDKFFEDSLPPSIASCIHDELNEAIDLFWEDKSASWRMVCLNATEWLLHRTKALQDGCFDALPIGSFGDGAGDGSQYGLCNINRRRAERYR